MEGTLGLDVNWSISHFYPPPPLFFKKNGGENVVKNSDMTCVLPKTKDLTLNYDCFPYRIHGTHGIFTYMNGCFLMVNVR